MSKLFLFEVTNTVVHRIAVWADSEEEAHDIQEEEDLSEWVEAYSEDESVICATFEETDASVSSYSANYCGSEWQIINDLGEED